MNHIHCCVALTTLLTLGLLGCSSIDTVDNYKQATVADDIVYPDSVDRPKTEELFVIPDTGFVSASDTPRIDSPTILPPKAQAGVDKFVSMRKLGDLYWILAQYRVNTLWNNLEDFARTQEYPMERSDPIAGELETKWIPNGKDPHIKLLFQVNRGIQLGTSEVSVLAMEGKPGKRVDWSGTTDQALGLSTLKRTAKFLSLLDTQPQAEVGKQHDELKIKTDKESDNNFLYIGVKPNRAWAAILHAIKLSDYSVTKHSSESGLIVITTGNQPVQKKSFWLSPKPAKLPETLSLQLKPFDAFGSALTITSDDELSTQQSNRVFNTLIPNIN
ncbi:MAG: outer membrane protein assembly factor BamC [Pseudomonadota bacterium]